MRSFDEIASPLTSRLGSRRAKTLLDVPGGGTRSRSPGNSMLYRYGIGRHRVSGRLVAHCFPGAARHALPGYINTHHLPGSRIGCIDGSATPYDREPNRSRRCLVMCFVFCLPGARSLFN
jgi:hypothetical protein